MHLSRNGRKQPKQQDKMMKLTNTQIATLTSAAEAPDTCVTSFMQDIKNPMIRQRSLESMLAKSLIEKHPDTGNYRITAAGYAALGTPVEPVVNAGAAVAKPPRNSKHHAIIDLLTREHGATLAEIKEATGWQPHSVRGYLSNLRKKKNLPIEKIS